MFALGGRAVEVEERGRERGVNDAMIVFTAIPSATLPALVLVPASSARAPSTTPKVGIVITRNRPQMCDP